MQQARDRKIAPDKKYSVWKTAKKKEMVRLLMKDDDKQFLTKQQRTDLLTIVGKQYASEKKKAAIEKKEKISLATAVEKGMPMEEIIVGIKQKWIIV